MIYCEVAVVECLGKYLLLRRHNSDRSFGGWCFPGGKYDPEDQGPGITAIRELKEETGIQNLMPREQLSSKYSIDNNGREFYISVFKFQAVATNGCPPEVVFSDEHAEYRWIDLYNLSPDFDMGPATRSIIAEILFPRRSLYWPLKTDAAPLFPDYPGEFAAERKYDYHPGVDLYCKPYTPVLAVETGRVVAVEDFTGEFANPPTPWWNNTKAVLIESSYGVLGYGEIIPNVKVGQVVCGGSQIGSVSPVLKKNKGRPTSMLHFEEYYPGTRKTLEWYRDEELTGKHYPVAPYGLLNPTALLKLAAVNPRVFMLEGYDGFEYSDPSSPVVESDYWDMIKKN